jgi:hypothetical protein
MMVQCTWTKSFLVAIVWVWSVCVCSQCSGIIIKSSWRNIRGAPVHPFRQASHLLSLSLSEGVVDISMLHMLWTFSMC